MTCIILRPREPVRGRLFTLVPCGLGLALALAACSPSNAPPASVADSPTTAAAAGDDPCALLAAAEVRRIFPGAGPGERNRSTDAYGVATCIWDTPHGRLGIQTTDIGTGPAREILYLVVTGSLDPTRDHDENAIRYETLDGIGEQAVVVVEHKDAAHGVLSDIAAVGVRRGQREMALMSSELGKGDRDAALKSLAELARAAAMRL